MLDSLQIPLETVCDIIIEALALNEAPGPFEEEDIDEIPPIDEEMELNPHDDSDLEEFRSRLEDLNEEERLNLVAIAWIGRGSYRADEWEEAMEEARGMNPNHLATYLASLRQLGDYLEEGLAELGFSAEEFETGVR
ncbi:MAG: DUF3775 domain-containing protein [Alphaproteobacteria bacterium]|nr:MAG: DUF3775 domain-containing protein [Alphaproteobacteria bacterium]